MNEPIRALVVEDDLEIKEEIEDVLAALDHDRACNQHGWAALWSCLG